MAFHEEVLKNPKKIILAGGSGFLGGCLINHYYNSPVDITVLTRTPKSSDKNIKFIEWDGKTLGPWKEYINGCDVVINLTGESVNCRYNEKNKKEIIESRVHSTNILGEAINTSAKPPALWINSSSAAIYGDSRDAIIDESSPIAAGFSPDVCKIWESTFNEIKTPQTRKVCLRTGLVFGKNGGVLKPFIIVTRLGLGGKFGSGKQYISWMHEKDFCRVIDWIFDYENVSGTIICTGPEPVTNEEFMRALRKTLHIPFGIPNPAPLLKIGTKIIGTEAELILMGRRIIPKSLLDHGFLFNYPNLDKALKEII